MYINTVNINLENNDEYIEVVILTNEEMNNDKLKFIAIKKAESKVIFNKGDIDYITIITKEFKFKTHKVLSVKTLEDN
ncbi:MAG: hypothetical protein ACRCW9_03995 [Cetobacterium sp.]